VSRWLRLAAWIGLLVVLGAAVVVLRERWEVVGETGGLPGVVPSVAAAAVFFVANALLAWNWRAIVAVGGTLLPFRTALWIWSVSQITRYTMTMAHVGSRVVVAARYGVSATAGALSTVLELAWMLTVTSAIVLATIPWWLPAAGDARAVAWIAVAPVAGILVALAKPRMVLDVLERMLATGPLRRLSGGRFEGWSERVQVDRATLGRFVGRYGTNTVLRHIAFLTLFTAVGGDLRTGALSAIGAYALGSLAGTLAVFAPAGLGVREGVIALVLGPVIGVGPALVLVASARFLELVAELCLLGVARLTRPSASRPVAGGPPPAAP
jgi:glycosyltransferase 2 family protein